MIEIERQDDRTRASKVTFGSLLSQIRLSVVCLSYVTFVHPTQGV